MQLNPYLSFNGQCEAAFKFYEQCFGGKILHASLTVAGQTLMGADAPPERYQKPLGMHVTIGLTDVAEAGRIFAARAENGTVEMPLQETFWAVGFGLVVDRFGIPWMVNCGRPV